MDWEQNRAAQMMDEETIRAAWATSRESWKKIGVTRLKWVTHPGCCPWCQKINGRTVGIEEQFMADGEVITAEDEKGNFSKMKISGAKSHPPIHRGCRCGIDPVFTVEYRQGKPKDRQQMLNFISARDKLPLHLRAFVTPYTAKEYRSMNVTVFLAEDDRSGFALKPDGELISVFSLPGAKMGEAAARTAIKEGATHLDCVDAGYLRTFYQDLGFEVTEVIPWDEQYAPEGWDYDRFGRPDILTMKREDEGKRGKKKRHEFGKNTTPELEDLAKEFVNDCLGGLPSKKEKNE